MVRKRIDYVVKQVEKAIQWHKLIYPGMMTSNNNREHGSIEMTQAEATKEKNQLYVKLNLEFKAKTNRKYPALNIEDKVKIAAKYDKIRQEKEPLANNKYEIENIEQTHGLNIYTINGRPRLRNELMAVQV